MFSFFSRNTSNEEARRRVAAGAVLLDVRTPGEYADGHVQGAKNIPVQELAKRFGELPPKADVVVYCRSGARSAVASQMLNGRGHTVLDVGPMSAY
jgi:phage shock protein E